MNTDWRDSLEKLSKKRLSLLLASAKNRASGGIGCVICEYMRKKSAEYHGPCDDICFAGEICEEWIKIRGGYDKEKKFAAKVVRAVEAEMRRRDAA